MKHLKLFQYVITGLFLLNQANAQEFKKTASQSANIKKLMFTVEANPEQIKAHEAFILSLRSENDPFLIAQYDRWISRFPKSATVPFAIGKELAGRGDPRAKTYLLKAVSINSGLAEAWEHLSMDALFRGDAIAYSDYMGKAEETDRKNPDYAYYYANSFKAIDSLKYDSLLLDVAWRFKGHNRGVQALFNIAGDSDTDQEKTAYYEELYSLYHNEQPDWFANAMGGYYSFLINTNPQKAFELALKMSFRVKTNRHYWKHKLETAKKYIEAKNLLNAGQPDQAIEVIKQIDLGSTISGSFIDLKQALILLKAQAYDGARQTQTAFDSLASYYSAEPGDMVRLKMLEYGSKLGLDEKQVDVYIRQLRTEKAKLATAFNLKDYLTGDSLSLSDLKGKIVLLTYWFPGCGPCRAEFPHFESVIRKFDQKNVAYVGINVDTKQDDYVVPYMKASGYGLTPLRDDANWDKGNLSMSGAPTNYLIDQNGRIIFSDFRINDQNERMLELMISELMKDEVVVR